MAKFTNVDYNKDLYFSDDNPFATSFANKLQEGKNAAITAYDNKVNSFVDHAMMEVRTSMKGPQYAQLILNQGTDSEMLNPKFYDLMNASPESIMRGVQKSASEQGLNPRSIKPSMIMTEELGLMKKEAVQQHYEQLAQYKDRYGASKLQNLLDKEGHKFQSFYRKFSDPYALSGDDLWIPPTANKQLRLAAQNNYLKEDIASGSRFKRLDDGTIVGTTGRHQTVGFSGMNDMEVKKDDDGRYYTEGLNPLTALMSNLFGSGNIDITRSYLADEENPDEMFWWAK